MAEAKSMVQAKYHGNSQSAAKAKPNHDEVMQRSAEPLFLATHHLGEGPQPGQPGGPPNDG